MTAMATPAGVRVFLQRGRVLGSTIRFCLTSSRGTSEFTETGFQRCRTVDTLIARSFYSTTSVKTEEVGKKTYKTNSILQIVRRLEGGQEVEVTWTDGVISKFHSTWLRYNCQCGECRHHASNQRLLDISTISHVHTVADAIAKDCGDIELTWVEDGHRGVIGQDFLRFYRYDDDALRHKYESTQPLFLKEKPIPEIDYSETQRSEYGLYKWLKHIGDYGICLLKGVPAENEYLKKVVERIGPVQQVGDLESPMYDMKQEAAPWNVAYTNKGLCFHMDLQPLTAPPGLQYLHCLRFDDTVLGGETLFIDMFDLAERFREQHPEHFTTFLNVPVLFERVYHDRNFHFACQRTHIKLNRENQKIRLSKSIGTRIWKVRYRLDIEVDAYYGAYRAFLKMMEDWPYIKAIRLHPGDMVCFNNRRMSHGRRAFEETAIGSRFLQGCYSNIDDFRSMLQSLATRFGEDGPARKVGSDSMM